MPKVNALKFFKRTACSLRALGSPLRHTTLGEGQARSTSSWVRVQAQHQTLSVKSVGITGQMDGSMTIHPILMHLL